MASASGDRDAFARIATAKKIHQVLASLRTSELELPARVAERLVAVIKEPDQDFDRACLELLGEEDEEAWIASAQAWMAFNKKQRSGKVLEVRGISLVT